MTKMLVDESKMAVDDSFSFLNLGKQHTNLKLKLLFKIENTKPLSLRKTLLTIDQIQIIKDLTATDQVQVAPYTHSRDRSIQIAKLYSYTSQPWIHALGKKAHETNT